MTDQMTEWLRGDPGTFVPLKSVVDGCDHLDTLVFSGHVDPDECSWGDVIEKTFFAFGLGRYQDESGEDEQAMVAEIRSHYDEPKHVYGYGATLDAYAHTADGVENEFCYDSEDGEDRVPVTVFEAKGVRHE